MDANILAAEYDLHALPAGVTGQLLVDKVLELPMQPRHELCPWGDAVGVKMRLRGKHFALLQRLAYQVLRFTCRTKPGKERKDGAGR